MCVLFASLLFFSPCCPRVSGLASVLTPPPSQCPPPTPRPRHRPTSCHRPTSYHRSHCLNRHPRHHWPRRCPDRPPPTATAAQPISSPMLVLTSSFFSSPLSPYCSAAASFIARLSHRRSHCPPTTIAVHLHCPSLTLHRFSSTAPCLASHELPPSSSQSSKHHPCNPSKAIGYIY